MTIADNSLAGTKAPAATPENLIDATYLRDLSPLVRIRYMNHTVSLHVARSTRSLSTLDQLFQQPFRQLTILKSSNRSVPP